MKPALFWTLKRQWHARYELMAVTSEKGGARGRYFGRDEHGNPTHCRRGETYGRFTDADAARALLGTVGQIKGRYAADIRDAENGVQRLRNACEAEIDAAIRAASKVAA